MNRERKAAAIAFAAIGLVAAIGWGVAYCFHVQVFQRQLDNGMALVAPSVENRIGGYSTLTDLLSEDTRLAEVLAAPSRSVFDALGDRFRSLADSSGAHQIYLLNTSGKVVASSAWVGYETLPDIDLAFRPYFMDAMQTGHGGFYGFNIATGTPDYYLASRIDAPAGAGPLGVVALSFQLLPNEEDWWEKDSVIALVDRTGVIVMSSRQDWLYRPLRALSPGILDEIARSRQFDGVDLAGEPPLLDAARADKSARIGGEDFMLRSKTIGAYGWTLLVAKPFSGAQAAANAIAMLLALFGFVVSGLVLIFLQHRQLARIRSEQSVLLEKQVAERTRELAEEVEIRRRTEANLREAESDLVQAAKLAALGQMSTALVHEVSQPITALAAMLTAAERRLDAAETASARQLLDRAQNLVQRIQHIIRHLRSFSKKESGECGRLVLANSIRAALELAEPRAREININIASDGLDQPAEIVGNAVRFEQVLINLLLNALDAVAGRDRCEVGIALEVDAQKAIVSVWDTGPGIPEGFADKLSEPFFTTKSDGDGVGLGLTISQSILSDFGASLNFMPRDGGGTICEVRVPLADAPKSAEAAE